MSLYNLVADHFKRVWFRYWILPLYIYHASTVLFPIKKKLNIDKYFVCESRDIIYNSFKIKNYFVHMEIA